MTNATAAALVLKAVGAECLDGGRGWTNDEWRISRRVGIELWQLSDILEALCEDGLIELPFLPDRPGTWRPTADGWWEILR